MKICFRMALHLVKGELLESWEKMAGFEFSGIMEVPILTAWGKKENMT